MSLSTLISSKKYLSVIFSIMAGFAVGFLTLKLAHISILEALEVMWSGAFSKPEYMATILVRSTPLILTGLSVAFAFNTGLFNIGAEGQYIIGAAMAAYFGHIINLPAWISIPAIILIAMFISGMYAGLAGFLKAKFQIHEVISTIMLNWIALYYSNWLVMSESVHRPNTETTEFIQNSASITMFENWRTPLHAGIFLAVFFVIVVWYVLNKTTFGLGLRAVGFNPQAAQYAGQNVKLKIIQSMFISGSLAGLAGAVQVLGVSKNIAILAAHEGYGFDGIAVSLIAVNSIIPTILSGLFIGTLKFTGPKIQSALEAPSEIINIMIGSIIFFMAVPTLFENLFKFKKRQK